MKPHGADRVVTGRAKRCDRTAESRKPNGMGAANPKVRISPKIQTLKKSKLSCRYADKYGIVRKKSLDFFLFMLQSFMIELEVIK